MFSFAEIMKAVILGIVQGITEWLPVSSTGHMILVNEFIHMNFSEQFINTFLVVIQFGSILAVVMIFFKKLNPFDRDKKPKEKRETVSLWIKVLIAIVPSGVIGVLFEDEIDAIFFNSTVVAIALIVYGVIMIMLENRNKKPKYKSFDDVSYSLALKIGMFQCLALIPGTSRSGSTIIGAVLLGASRFVAAEFSFFMAIPTMLGASALKLWKAGFGFSGFEWLILGVGSVVAFVVSVIVIKLFMDYIKKHDFKPFGYYRIALGIVVLVYFFMA
ncbi:MAG: undecaprenyl-diphosphate phosphatase [Clostridioides sp.]|nr:undecaprenyl-diphosphate phosphatase [Clostridioides sp.]